MICPNCTEEVERFIHLHDEAHGVSGTHMSGSERFECPECDRHLTREEAENFGLKYELD